MALFHVFCKKSEFDKADFDLKEFYGPHAFGAEVARRGIPSDAYVMFTLSERTSQNYQKKEKDPAYVMVIVAGN